MSAINTGIKDGGSINVDSGNSNVPAYNVGNASKSTICASSSNVPVPSGRGCYCKVIDIENDADYISDLQVKCGNFMSGEGIYEMSKPNPRSSCIIFNIEKFHVKTLEYQEGSSYEAKCIKRVFEQLFFKVDVINGNEEEDNCRKQDIIIKLKEIRELLDHQYQALFVFFYLMVLSKVYVVLMGKSFHSNTYPLSSIMISLIGREYRKHFFFIVVVEIVTIIQILTPVLSILIP